MHLVVGLGNPGLRYRNTMHNVGFMAIDVLSRQWDIKLKQKKFEGILGQGMVDSEKIMLLKPTTYMNLSGESVNQVCHYFSIDPKDVIIIYDDIDLDFGRLRIRPQGSGGTHKGMKSIIGKLQTTGFIRIRIGIGKPPPYMELKDYVLSRLNRDQKIILASATQQAAMAAEWILKRGVEAAQMRFNSKG